jgi:hypothetical protein
MGKERLYEAFGELLYALMKTGEMLQPEGLETIRSTLGLYTWGDQTLWSFFYEFKRATSPEMLYVKALTTCQDFGQAEEYKSFFETAEKLIATQIPNSLPAQRMLSSFQRKILQNLKDSWGMQTPA